MDLANKNADAIANLGTGARPTNLNTVLVSDAAALASVPGFMNLSGSSSCGRDLLFRARTYYYMHFVLAVKGNFRIFENSFFTRSIFPGNVRGSVLYAFHRGCQGFMRPILFSTKVLYPTRSDHHRLYPGSWIVFHNRSFSRRN
jgi:hypothetical protein